jgi:tripartite-type tricarboxylate transporter receptor subunit TctC
MRLLLLALALAVMPAAAQERYPSKPLRLVVPFAPGGSTDIFARLIADRLAAPLGQPVVVENRSGAAGNIGAEAVARAAPDGYTLLMATTGVMAINNAMYRNMTYDAAKDFEPVVFVASITNVLIVPPELPAASVAELIALAKREPGKLSFASSGAGSSTHMSAELFKSLSGTDILHIPYKGSGQALPDLMSGRVSMMFENMPGAVSHIKASPATNRSRGAGSRYRQARRARWRSGSTATSTPFSPLPRCARSSPSRAPTRSAARPRPLASMCAPSAKSGRASFAPTASS